MKKIILILSTILISCTNNDKAIRVLEEAGYTEIELTGHNFFLLR